MGKALKIWGEKMEFWLGIQFVLLGEKGSKMGISMDKLTFSGELFEEFHAIKGDLKVNII